jgi:hypothetical protein
MLTWPWTTKKSFIKELQKRQKQAQDHPETCIRFTSVAELIANRPIKKPSFFTRLKWDLHDISWKVYRYFVPAHKQIRNSIPRQWTDITELIIIVNFEFIKSFYENEKDSTDWVGTSKQAAEFVVWLEEAYNYIKVERPRLEIQISQSYPHFDAKGTYDELYGELNRLESLLEQKDTDILVEMIKKRGFFWS